MVVSAQHATRVVTSNIKATGDLVPRGFVSVAEHL
jgi:hypothetical protein